MGKRGVSHISRYYLMLIPLIAVLLVLGAYLYISDPAFTGLAVQDPYQDYTKQLNLRFESSSTINFDLDRVPLSLKLKGSFENDTVARVYFIDDGIKYLLLNTEALNNTFEDVCAETCELETIQENVILAIEVDSGVLILDEAKYVSYSSENNAPKWTGRKSFFIDGITTEDIDLDEFVSDADNDNITYFIRSRNPFDAVLVDEHILRITTNEESGGDYDIRIFASDMKHTTDISIQLHIMGLEEEAIEDSGLDPDTLAYTEPCRDFTTDNETVLLTGNARRFEGSGTCFRISANNFVLDCANAVIHADNAILASGDNIEIKNCLIYSREHGMILKNSINAYIHDNEVHNGRGTGILLKNILSSQVSRNLLDDNLFGIRLFSSDGYNEIADNIINENRASGILLADTREAVVIDNVLTGNFKHGISLFLADNNLIKANNITGSGEAITVVADSKNNELVGNFINTTSGIYFENSKNNMIKGNKLRNGLLSYDILAVNNVEINNEELENE
ncbi:MAG: right-handed parallel beta-helix repeat-containing protein [Nanoarchaeota archaeon]|nr:right-handed parallel beta-helix repeat-containing protein [Nanoarchaeota archaeon]